MVVGEENSPEELRKRLETQERELLRLRTRLTQVGLEVEHEELDEAEAAGPRRRSEVEKRVQWKAAGTPIRDVSEEDDVNDHVLHKRSRTSTEMFLNHMTDVEEREAALAQRVQELEEQLEESHAMGKAETAKSDTGSRRPSSTSTQGHKERQELQEELDAYQDALERQEKREAELRQKYQELEGKCAEQQATICELEVEVANGKSFLDQANNRYSDLWRKAEDHRKQLNQVKESLEQRERQLAAEREQRADLDMKMRSRKSSHVRASLAVEFGAAADDAELNGDLAQMDDDDQPLQEEVQLLREEVDRVQTHLFEALEERDALQKVEKDLRQDLQSAHRKFEEQLKVTEGFAESERTLRRQLTDVTSRTSLRSSSRMGLEGLLQNPSTTNASSSASNSSGGQGSRTLAQVSEEQILEGEEQESAKEAASASKAQLQAAESLVQELQRRLDDQLATEQQLRSKVAALEQQMAQGLPVSISSTGASGSGCGGGDVAGGGAPAAVGLAEEAPKEPGSSQAEEELRCRAELLELRSQLREVACALLEEIDAAPASPPDDESWVDSWMLSAKRIVCCRDGDAPGASDPATLAARRRELLWRLIHHLDQHSDEAVAASTFDATSF